MQDDFVARATELGATVHLPASRDDAVTEIVDLFRSSGAREVAMSGDLGEFGIAVDQALAGEGAKFAGENAVPQELARADIGITCATIGVAETGSVVLAGNDTFARFASMLPLIHVAVLDPSRIVNSLDEAGEYLRRTSTAESGQAVRYSTLVSGPSRTSDVEKTLTVGVHGPGQLHVFLLS